MDTYQPLLSSFGHDLEFRIKVWSFEILHSVRVDPTAIHAAVDADAIIVATHQRNGLPPAIREWVETWVPRKRGQTAVLIGLFDLSEESPGTSFPTADYLKNAAASAGLEFLVQRVPAARKEFLSPTELRSPANCPAREGWGLND